MIGLPTLQPVMLLRRYKRFLADVEDSQGHRFTVHCPNTGAMTGCAEPGSQAWVSKSDNAQRKYPHTLELVRTAAGLVSVNTQRANHLVAAALRAGLIATEQPIHDIVAEARIPDESGRFDFRLELGDTQLFIEVKSVTLHRSGKLGAFPDATSTRALKHVMALSRRIDAGEQAMLLFCVQHEGIRSVEAAADIDPGYAAGLSRAQAQGVQVRAYGCCFDPRLNAMGLDQRIPFNGDLT